jgi:hypothetical protein
MRPLARVLIDESHRQAWTTRPEVAARMNPVNPADASYQRAAVGALASGLDVVVHESGPLDDAALAHVDALVLPHAADDAWEHTTGIGSPRLTEDEIAALERFVIAGGGLVILGETEQPKYGNNFADLAMRFGIEIDNSTVQDPAQCYREVPTWVLADLVRGEHHDLTAKVAARLLLPRRQPARRFDQRRCEGRDDRAHVGLGRPIVGEPGHDREHRRRSCRRHSRLGSLR